MPDPERYTWDGLPIAADEPYGASIVVWRRPPGAAAAEYLILHRGHHGPGFEGDWAWTPPAGSRQPGEPVLAATCRELAEEAGLTPAPSALRALDLRGRWVLFGLEVSTAARIRLDAEHDRFEWLSAQAAVERCRPALVADGLRRAQAAITPAISFRPLALTDLPDLVAWRQAPHAARWFTEELDLAAAERKYRPRIEGESPTRVHVALADGQPCGFLQNYRIADYPDYAAATAEPDAVAIDYAIGMAGLTGRGLGPQLIWQYLQEVVLPAHPAVRQVAASPAVENTRSIAALEKAGFRPLREVAGAAGRTSEMLCLLDRQHFLG